MKTFVFQVAGLLIITFVIMYAVFNNTLFGGPLMPFSGNNGGSNGGNRINQTAKSDLKKIVIVSNDDKITKATLSIEVADTPDKRGLGLGDRNSLDPNSGMLFLFSQPGTYNFWMKGMKFPLDFIWIYSDQVVETKSDVPPPASGQTELPLYHASQTTDRVLEVNAGFIKTHNIIPGDKVRQLN